MPQDGRFNELRKAFGRKEKLKTVAGQADKTAAADGLALSRRNVLQGGAIVAAGPKQAASMALGAVEALPKEVVERSAALMAPFAKLFSMAEQFGEPGESSGEVLDREFAEHEETISHFQKVMSGEIKADSIGAIGDVRNLFQQLSTLQHLLDQSLTLDELMSGDVATKAYKLAGGKKDPGMFIRECRRFVSMLEQISGDPLSSTLSEVTQTLASKRLEFAGRVIQNLSSFETPVHRRSALAQLKMFVRDPNGMGESTYTPNEEEERMLSEIQSNLQSTAEDLQAQAERERIAHQSQLDKVGSEQRTEVLKPIPISAAVTAVSSNQRQAGMTRSFHIRPLIRHLHSQAIQTDGLTRMNVDRYRQQLYEAAGKTEEFRHDNLVVREDIGSPENGILIDTSDPLLIAELDKAMKEDRTIQLPDRL